MKKRKEAINLLQNVLILIFFLSNVVSSQLTDDVITDNLYENVEEKFLQAPGKIFHVFLDYHCKF